MRAAGEKMLSSGNGSMNNRWILLAVIVLVAAVVILGLRSLGTSDDEPGQQPSPHAIEQQ